MMNQIGASAPPADPFDVGGGTTSAQFMGGSDPVVAGYNKSEGVVNLSYFYIICFNCFLRGVSNCINSGCLSHDT